MPLRIATWNLKRPSASSKDRNSRIIKALKEIDADILILTETSSLINPGNEYTPYCSEPLPALRDSVAYEAGENRTTIWSKKPAIRRIETSDPFTCVCVSVETPLGELAIYGTIIGIFGREKKTFLPALKSQIIDWGTICDASNICVAGDFNITFSDSYYFTHEGRDQIAASFAELKINNLTSDLPENIDHIAISESVFKTTEHESHVWIYDKTLSDHKGICVTLKYSDEERLTRSN